MQDLQFINAVMDRHDRILARQAKKAALAEQPFQVALAANLPAPGISAVKLPEDAKPAEAAAQTPASTAETKPTSIKPATPQLSEAQMAMLMGSLGIQPEAKPDEPAAAPPTTDAKSTPRAVSDAQMAMLFSSLGVTEPPSAAKAEPSRVQPQEAEERPAEPQAEPRFFPISDQNRGTAAASASEAYLRTLQTIEQTAGVMQAAP
jgi:hypothetical protein